MKTPPFIPSYLGSLLATACLLGEAVGQDDTASAVRQRILETYNHARQTLKMGPEHASEFTFNSNGSLLQYVPREQPTTLQFAHFNLAPSNIHVTTLVEGKAAVAMFYSQGDVQFAGGPMVRGYRTRVSQTWVNGEGGWTMKTAHYSPMAGGEGVVSIPSESMSEGKTSRAPVVHSARAALADSEMSGDIEDRIDFVFQYWREKHRGFAGANGLHVFNSNGGMLAHQSPVQVVEFPVSTVMPRDVHVIPLVDGEAAVAMFYAEGSLQVKGGPLTSNYRTRVSQTFVKEYGLWHCKTEHWSKLAGAQGVQPQAVAAEVEPTPEDQSAYSQDCAEIDAVKHSIRMYVGGNIDAWRACFDKDASYIHNRWGVTRPIDELADIHRAFHEAIESVQVTNYNFECVTNKDGLKTVHSWLNFRAKYKTGEVDERCGAFSVRIGENNLFTLEIGLYDTAGMPGAAPYGEQEKGDK
ncbi:MAG: hypothetical protein VX044_00570 [Planctomycetota bacterium]|nr:hypothetical protein [Planctomycetota bacterium]MEC8651215.1 hypothetical protein [Planctomycetota bacterium]